MNKATRHFQGALNYRIHTMCTIQFREGSCSRRVSMQITNGKPTKRAAVRLRQKPATIISPSHVTRSRRRARDMTQPIIPRPSPSSFRTFVPVVGTESNGAESFNRTDSTSMPIPFRILGWLSLRIDRRVPFRNVGLENPCDSRESSEALR